MPSTQYSLSAAVCFLAMFLCIAWLAGCDQKTSDNSGAQPKPTDNAKEHDDHPHGPHDGEVMELDGPQDAPHYHGEWTHDDESGKVTVYILDGKSEGVVPIAATEVTIDVKVEGADPQTFTLPASDPNDEEPPKASRFESKDEDNPKLLTALKLKEGVDAKLHVQIDGADYTGKVEYVEHDDHGHAH